MKGQVIYISGFAGCVTTAQPVLCECSRRKWVSARVAAKLYVEKADGGPGVACGSGLADHRLQAITVSHLPGPRARNPGSVPPSASGCGSLMTSPLWGRWPQRGAGARVL